MTANRRKPMFERLKQSLEEAIAKVDESATGCGQKITKHSDLKRAVLKHTDVKTEYEALGPEFELLRQKHRRRDQQ